MALMLFCKAPVAFLPAGNTMKVLPPDTLLYCVGLVWIYFSSFENERINEAGRWVLPGRSLMTAPTVILKSLLYLNIFPIGFSLPKNFFAVLSVKTAW